MRGAARTATMFTDIPMHDRKSAMKQLVITDLDIQALVDNADAPTREERRFLMEIVANDVSLTKRYDELVRQKELLQAWWKESEPRAALLAKEMRCSDVATD